MEQPIEWIMGVPSSSSSPQGCFCITIQPPNSSQPFMHNSSRDPNRCIGATEALLVPICHAGGRRRTVSPAAHPAPLKVGNGERLCLHFCTQNCSTGGVFSFLGVSILSLQSPPSPFPLLRPSSEHFAPFFTQPGHKRRWECTEIIQSLQGRSWESKKTDGITSVLMQESQQGVPLGAHSGKVKVGQGI